MARLGRTLALRFVLLSLFVVLWSHCCWVGQHLAMQTASVVGAVLLEVFIRLDQQGLLEAPGRNRQCNDVSLRVSRALGSRGYDAVRVSAVCRLAGQPSKLDQTCAPPGLLPVPGDGQALALDSFKHCSPFKHRWSHFHLSSSLARVEPGVTERLLFNHSAGPLAVDVRLPEKGSGVHGVVLGDPCISSRYLPGLCNANWDVTKRLATLLDLVATKDRLDFIIILGDAFYDVHGGLTAQFWRHLSWQTQQVPLLAVPGNHDFWMFAPQAPLPQDQLGFGFAQWFAQDTAAATHSGPFLTREPNQALGEPAELPSAENFFFYHTLGNLGFLGYSAAHPWEAQEKLFQEACNFFASDPPDHVYLLGHWTKAELGCKPGMDVPSLFSNLQEGACAEVADRMFYLLGHDHCNQKMEDGRGFMVGGVGAAHGNCNEWGFGYIDTRPESQPPVSEHSGRTKVHQIAKITVASDSEEIKVRLFTLASQIGCHFVPALTPMGRCG